MVIRWLVIGLAVVILSVALAAVSNWWFLHVPTNGSVFGSRIQPGGFDVTGIVPAAYALFAFALGAALGMILRRTAQAIFGTVVLFTAARNPVRAVPRALGWQLRCSHRRPLI